MFQKCPVCNGNGYSIDGYPYTESTCSTCQGARIIDEITGLPPEGQIPRTITTTGGLVDTSAIEYKGLEIVKTQTQGLDKKYE